MHKVWFLASEVAPFAKTGGLADVAGSLPACLNNLGVDVRVGLPFYRMAKNGNFEAQKVLEGLEVPSGNSRLRGDVLKTLTEEGVPVYLFDKEDLYTVPRKEITRTTWNALRIFAVLPFSLRKRPGFSMMWSIATTGKPD